MLNLAVPEVQAAYRTLATALVADGVWVVTDAERSYYAVERDSALRVLQLFAVEEDAQEELAWRLAELPASSWTVDGQPYVFWELGAMAVELNAFSDYAPLTPWIDWLAREVLPAMRDHGYYNPATGHEPPPSKLLDALECAEHGREVFDLLWVDGGGAV